MVSKLHSTLLVLVLACTLALSSASALGLAVRHAPHPRWRAKTRPLRHRPASDRRSRAKMGSRGGPRRATRRWHRHRRPRPEPRRRHRRARPEPTFGVRLVRYARRMLGIPYVWGGGSPAAGFDCSGLVRYVYGHFGFDLPHSSYLDFDLGVSVPRRALRPGDLVFFFGLGHVGIYVGADRFIQAPHTGARVDIARLSTPWVESAYVGARRIVNRWGRLLRRF